MRPGYEKPIVPEQERSLCCSALILRTMGRTMFADGTIGPLESYRVCGQCEARIPHEREVQAMRRGDEEPIEEPIWWGPVLALAAAFIILAVAAIVYLFGRMP